MHGILHNNNFSYRIFIVKVMHAWFCVFCTQLCTVIRDYIYMVMQGFPFPTMDYSPWSSKNLIIWNWLKKFMQVEVNVLCLHTNFDG